MSDPVTPVPVKPYVAEPFFVHAKVATMDDYREAASYLGCDVILFRAVCLVESCGHGFDASGFPVILVEPHIIWAHATLLERRALSPLHLAYPKWGMYPYGTYAAQKQRFQTVEKIAGLELATLGTSFGLTQILGENFKACGFAFADDFYNAMCQSEYNQLVATAKLMRSKGMRPAMQGALFSQIAHAWNGPGAVKAYSFKLLAAYVALQKSTYAENTHLVPHPGAMTSKLMPGKLVAVPPAPLMTEVTVHKDPPRWETPAPVTMVDKLRDKIGL